MQMRTAMPLFLRNGEPGCGLEPAGLQLHKPAAIFERLRRGFKQTDDAVAGGAVIDRLGAVATQSAKQPTSDFKASV